METWKPRSDQYIAYTQTRRERREGLKTSEGLKRSEFVVKTKLHKLGSYKKHPVEYGRQFEELLEPVLSKTLQDRSGDGTARAYIYARNGLFPGQFSIWTKPALLPFVPKKDELEKMVKDEEERYYAAPPDYEAKFLAELRQKILRIPFEELEKYPIHIRANWHELLQDRKDQQQADAGADAADRHQSTKEATSTTGGGREQQPRPGHKKGREEAVPGRRGKRASSTPRSNSL